MQTLSAELIAFIAIAYIFLLFIIAYRGDQKPNSGFITRNRSLVYSLSLAVYCSSWTFFGAVGSATRTGWEFFAIYLGPMLVFVFGYKMIQRIIIISKQYSITSISDFLSARYGKSRNVAVLVTFIAVIGSLPYISLQLHAISISFTILTTEANGIEQAHSVKSFWSDTAFYGAMILALFSILFGTRHLSATEHHRGMMNAIAFESIVKLLAILLVGLYATQLLFERFNWAELLSQPFALTSIGQQSNSFSWSDFTTNLVLSMGAIMLLPRQFQVTVVESDDHHQMKTARWLMPLYLLLISLAVIPIALAGMIFLPDSGNADFFVLNLPQQNSYHSLAMIAFVGGISAATGMVIVASISLSTMVCNDVVMPLLIRSKYINIKKRPDLSQLILTIRRITIVLLLLSSYGYFRISGNNQQLANMGLLSFAAIIQFAPALIAAMYWQRANQRGVLMGLGIGFVTWAYCLLMPNFVSAESLDLAFRETSWIHPHHLFNITFDSSLTHGVVWSLLLNSAVMIVGSIRYTPSVLDKIQASVFTHTHINPENARPKSSIAANATIENARVLCESIIGKKRTSKLFSRFESTDGKVTQEMIEGIERAIASVIGASSASQIITTQLLGEDVTAEDLFVMMGETSQALRFNQEVLQASFENISQGISVVDKDQNLVAWNSRYQTLFDYPDEMLKIGTPVEALIRFNVERGDCGPGDINELVERRLHHIRMGSAHTSERKTRGIYIKTSGNPLPGGGFVTSFTDITKNVKAAELLKKTNELLEERVSERTLDLEHLNQKLQAENVTSLKLSEKLESVTKSKTRFLAAASHDLLQPINAARLFTNSLIDHPTNPAEYEQKILKKIDSSLVNADKLLRALLDISRLDTGTLRPQIRHFKIDELMQGLRIELSPLAAQKGISIKFMPCSTSISSDKTLLRSIIQNLITNAIRYTDQGKVLIGCRVRSKALVIQVLDTGAGIGEEDLPHIFNEFHRAKHAIKKESGGLGLGLAITKRLSEILNHPLEVVTQPGKGSLFSITVPRYFGTVDRPQKHNAWQPAGSLKGLTVLYLENSKDSLKAMSVLLRNWGCKVISCRTYPQAIKAIHKNKYKIDLILADYRLDQTETGVDFLDYAAKFNNEITGVLVTAEQDLSIKDEAIENGYTFLAKPVEPAALRGILSRLAGVRKLQPAKP